MDRKKSDKPTREEWFKGIQREARKRVVARGIVHFRLNEELMEVLLQVSEHKQVGAGILARMWVVEQLRQEQAKLDVYKPSSTTSDQTLAEPKASYAPKKKRASSPRKARKKS